jgi:hypothetical protein
MGLEPQCRYSLVEVGSSRNHREQLTNTLV